MPSLTERLTPTTHHGRIRPWRAAIVTIAVAQDQIG
jgi:hypothetical protein